jgi:HEPN domain-containing protein
MHDPEREAGRWLRAAHEDLAYARHAASGGFHAPACFHAQQAAEKAVKALHYRGGARAVIGHNIRTLIEAIVSPEPRVAALTDAARELDLFYLATRYPNGLDAGTPGEAFSEAQSGRALDLATRIVGAVADLIGGDR